MQEIFEKIIERLEEVRDERALVAEYTLDVFPDGQVSGLEKAIEIVNQVAEEYSNSEIPNKSDGWIPCSERLPEIDGKYIVCTTKGSVYCTKYHSRGEIFGTDINTHIEAWQPLPAPYKPKGEK